MPCRAVPAPCCDHAVLYHAQDNYLIGMLNKGVLRLAAPLPGLRRRPMLTKTLEWNLRWGVLDHMFDEATFTLRQDFIADEARLRRRES